MPSRLKSALSWLDLLWIIFLGGLALLSPIAEWHKQVTLAAIGVFQFLERRVIAWLPERGPSLSVLVKICLATLLLGHTGEIGINSSYYPIYYVPVITAAIYFGPIATLLWTGLASAAYCSYLIPALQEYELTPAGVGELAIRVLFFFFAAVLVNRFVMENRRQLERTQAVALKLEASNRELTKVQAEARRAERLAALGQLSAGLAHEIRNPLGVIKGSAEMLAKSLSNAQPVEGELAGYISSEVNRLNGMVARFLDFARPSQLELVSIHPAEVMDRALAAVQAQFPASQITVERHYFETPAIRADEQLCEQVFINLLQNAYEAVNGGGGNIRVSVAPAATEAEPGIAIEIEDSGPGVPAELREQIFNPFVTSKKSGVGLGLSIVAKIVDDHHGSVQLTDRSEGGACFRIFLPSGESAGVAGEKHAKHPDC